MPHGTAQAGPVFIAGATGYVGGRLAPLLLARGHEVRAAARSPRKLAGRPWAGHPNLSIVPADVTHRASLVAGMRGCRAAFYLVHSMGLGGDFARADREAAENMTQAAKEAGVERIVYLGGLGGLGGLDGLGGPEEGLSEHLRSRAEVGRIFMNGPVPATVLRAAVILGSGSASFEIIRNLVERLPLMITPRWVRTRCQPIAVSNVLGYLAGCLENPATAGKVLDIGGPEVLTYGELFREYAAAAGVRAPLILPVPLLTPALSAAWVNLVTPVPMHLVRPLIEGLKNEAVCRNNLIRELTPQPLLTCREAMRAAVDELRQRAVPTCCHDAGFACEALPTGPGVAERIAAGAACPAEWSRPGDAPFAGGTRFTCDYAATLAAPPDEVWKAVARIGGETGWYAGDFLWRVRGFFDKLIGGPGGARGRRDPENAAVGDALDFWRVLDAQPEKRLLLLAEMKTPGTATLELRISPLEDQAGGGSRLMLLSTFQPRGLLGVAYWWAMYPAHAPLFKSMLGNIARAVGCAVTDGPGPLKQRPELAP